VRIDVALDHRDIDAELARLYERLYTPADALHGLPAVGEAPPGMAFRYREAAGELYVYVEDTARRALAGCTVFNRAFEVERRAQQLVRSPHSRYAQAYRRRGLASAVYRWALQQGWCLLSGPRQSVQAWRLWLALGRTHPLQLVQLRDKRMHCLAQPVDSPVFEEFETRMLLLGAGWDPARFARHAQCALPSPTADPPES
jgi:hypothetical protein